MVDPAVPASEHLDRQNSERRRSWVPLGYRGDMGDLVVEVIEAKDLIAADNNGKSDPYVSIRVHEGEGKLVKYKTKIIKETLNPTWNETFKIRIKGVPTITFAVKDWDRVGKPDPLGHVQLDLDKIEVGKTYDKWLKLDDVASGQLHLKITVNRTATRAPRAKLAFFEYLEKKEDRNYILLVDKSMSMDGERWSDAQKAVTSFASKVKGAQKDGRGLVLYFFSYGDPVRFDAIKDEKSVESAWKKVKPRGDTNLSDALTAAFSEHFKRKEKKVGTSYLVITDGTPNNREGVIRVIKEAIAKLKDASLFSLSFIQIGDDNGAEDFLTYLDDELEAAYDVIDAVTNTDYSALKLSFTEVIAKNLGEKAKAS